MMGENKSFFLTDCSLPNENVPQTTDYNQQATTANYNYKVKYSDWQKGKSLQSLCRALYVKIIMHYLPRREYAESFCRKFLLFTLLEIPLQAVIQTAMK